MALDVFARPWLGLYETHVPRPPSEWKFRGHGREEEWTGADLPVETLFLIFSRLSASELAAVSCVCKNWRAAAADVAHWKRVFRETWPKDSVDDMKRALWRWCSWRRAFVFRPRMRYDGAYITRHQYVHIAEKRPHLVQYFRIFRFFPGGTVLSLTASEKPAKIWSSMMLDMECDAKIRPSQGAYNLNEESLTVCVETPIQHIANYPNMRRGIVSWTLHLEQSHDGARNLLYVDSHYSLHEGESTPVYHPLDRFGSRPFVFVSDGNVRRRCAELFPEERSVNSWSKFYDEKGRLDLMKVYSLLPVDSPENLA